MAVDHCRCGPLEIATLQTQTDAVADNLRIARDDGIPIDQRNGISAITRDSAVGHPKRTGTHIDPFGCGTFGNQFRPPVDAVAVKRRILANVQLIIDNRNRVADL
ncbi:Type I phosphodiesterase/nucleotide pyrophosphatase [Pseudomonas putida]|uniref:Type I phosphodiesterase/nucleotide pyrophosphatase n=1 Tax=Pseudomonas putida TaxID=303 RepID=A0A1L7N9N8_PSEPU|nr:Type I phosphodiesterase/nucleotide pyrophosphatase [Pseudomonas putida]